MKLFLVVLLVAVLLVCWPALRTLALIFLGALAAVLTILLISAGWLLDRIWRFFVPR